MNKSHIILGASFLAGFIAWCAWDTLVVGTTDGPDFIASIQSGAIAADSITSIDVVEPAKGHTPFTKEEYNSLPVRTRIDAPASIHRLVGLLKNCQEGQVYQNHPTGMYSAYVRIGIQNDFFWLYCNEHRDSKSAVFYVKANTRNATNPNGGALYHLNPFVESLSLLQQQPKDR